MNRKKRLDWGHMRSVAIISLLLVAGAVFVLLSLVYVPQNKEDRIVKKYGGYYKYAHSEDILTLDPKSAVFTMAQNAVLLVFDPLIKVSDDMKLVPSICASWEMHNDGLTFICNIRRGIRFHNGDELTGRDVVFSLNHMARKEGLNLEASSLSIIRGIRNYWNGKASSVAGIRIVDDYTVAVDLEESCPYFAYIMSSPRYVIFPENFGGQDQQSFFRHPIGTGPFKYVKLLDNTLDVAANKTYFAGRPYLDNLQLTYYHTQQEALQAFVDGLVDDLTFYYFHELPQNISSAQYALKDSYSNLIVFPNNSRRPFNSDILRRLLFAAIDKQNVVKTCFQKSNSSETIIPSGIIGYDDNANRIPYDIKYAANLLNEIRKARISVPQSTIYAIESDVGMCATNMINRNFDELGLPWHLELTTSEYLAKYFFDGSMDAEIELIGVKNEDAYSILKFFGSDISENLARINDAEIDRLLKQVRYESDPLKRIVLYRTIDGRILEKNYAMPIVSPKMYSIWSKKYTHDDIGTARVVTDFTQISLSGNKI